MAAPDETFVNDENFEEAFRETTQTPYPADRGSGEPQQFYADAHYEPAGSTTVPPRYYTPPVRTERVKRGNTQKRGKKRFGIGAVISLCMVFAILGGIFGAAILYTLTENRLVSIEYALAESARANAENAGAIAAVSERQSAAASAVVSTAGGLPAAQIYERACSQVVGITTTVTTSSYFGRTSTGEISGSGFILSEDGYIITNYHVIEYAASGNAPVTVVLYDGSVYEAHIVGTEDVNDIAVLKIDASGLTPVTVGDSSAIQVGDEIYAVGNPLGELEFSMSTGHVSALNRLVSTEDAEDIQMFQLDAAVNPGNSGGPVYNTRGEVIGVVTAKYSDTGVEGLGFAIPINDAVRIAEDLVANGYVTGKAYLGVWLDERYNSMVAQYYNMPLGAYVSSVEPRSAAARAGLESGDIITAIGDQPVESSADLRAVIRQYGAGDSAALTIYRAGESKTVTVRFDEKTPESGTVRPGGDE